MYLFPALLRENSMFNKKKSFDSASVINEILVSMKPVKKGRLFKDSNVYFIEEDCNNSGYFALYRNTLEYLYLADSCGFLPVVSFLKNCPFQENTEIFGTDNPFEYYYEQPSGISVKDALKSYRFIEADVSHRCMVQLVFTGVIGEYRYSERFIDNMGIVAQKYIRYRKETIEFLNNSLNSINHKEEKTIGVHARGTDYKRKFNGHPKYVEIKQYFDIIDKMLSEGDYNRVFLATDDEDILRKFKDHYGESVLYCYRDTVRGDGNESVLFSKRNRDRHKYNLGLEVIRDAHTLSLCDALVAGVSQVSMSAQINKKAMDKEYKDISIIDNGTYNNVHLFRGR